MSLLMTGVYPARWENPNIKLSHRKPFRFVGRGAHLHPYLPLVRQHGDMSVTEPNCGVCKTFPKPGGGTWVIDHQFPKALEHYYALPPLGADSIPIYRGNFDHDGTRYRGIITVDLAPRPNLVARGVRELTFPDGIKEFIGKREPARWVDYDQLSIPARRFPKPAKTARALNSPPARAEP